MSNFTLLFDMDGTIVDSDRYHLAAFNALLSPFSRSVDEHYYRTHIMGSSNQAIMASLFPDADEPTHRQLGDEKERLFRDVLGDVEVTLGLLDILEFARSNRIPVGVVTNAPRPNAELMIRTLQLESYFSTIVSGTELPNPKPHPMPYLTGIEMLGGKVERAIAFEDSLSGIQSACGAGIETIGIATNLSPDVMRRAGATFAIKDFTAPQLWHHLSTRLHS